MPEKELAKVLGSEREIILCTCDADTGEVHQETCPFNNPKPKKKDTTE
ncbi:MAG: hypothetical protein WA051_02685 [Minisyncoccia bacterium]